MLDIKDRAGAISKALMRKCFEQVINSSIALKANTPLGAVTVNDEFSHYVDSETDTMWLGFALGMRCAERIAKAASNEPSQLAQAAQAVPAVTDDMRSAVRWAPSSAYWSNRLREFFGPDAREGIAALEKQLQEAQAQAVPQWTPVTERMPEPLEMVLVYCQGAEQCGIAWLTPAQGWLMPEPQAIGYLPSHWMPLPAAPGAAAPEEQAP